MSKNLLLWLVSLMAVLPLQAAEIPPGTVLSPQQIFRYNNHSDPNSIDPQRVEENTAAQVALDLFEGLIWLDGEGNPQPAQAQSWQKSDDGKTYIFSLRPGLTWSDGSALTAQDFVTGWQRAVDPAIASPFADYLAAAHVVNAQQIVNGKLAPQELGIRAVDQHTLEIKLDQATPWFISMLAWPTTFPVPHRQVAQYGDRWTRPENIVTNGAFVLERWIVNEKIIAKRNPHYWNNQKTVLEQVEYLVIDNAVSGYNRYRAGDVDLTWVPAQQISAIQRQTPQELLTLPRLNTEFYTFNTMKAPFNDVRVRRALYLTADRELIAEKVLGLRVPATTLTPAQVADFMPPELPDLSQPMRTRIAEAQALLKEAGYDAEHPLSFEIFYNKYDLHEKTAIALASIWQKNLRANVTLRNMEWKTYLDSRRSGDFMLSRQSWDATYNEPSTFLNTLLANNPENVGHWQDAQYNQLITQAASSTDAKKRNELYAEAERRINQQAPLIPLYYQPMIKVLKPYVGGFPLHNPQDYVYSKELYIKQH